MWNKPALMLARKTLAKLVQQISEFDFMTMDEREILLYSFDELFFATW
jgi:hypothetical protein